MDVFSTAKGVYLMAKKVLSEVQRLLLFMRTGKRKSIKYDQYIRLQEDKGNWSKQRENNLKRELSLSKVIRIEYQKKIDRTDTILVIGND